MRQTIIKTIFAAFIIIAINISCKKGGVDINDISTHAKFLTQQEWKFSKLEEKINSDPYMDRLPGFPACTQDDKYVFKTDNTYEVNEGGTKCNSSDPQVIITGTWQFTQNETKIKIDAAESNIDKLDDNTFIISGSYYTNPDTNYYRYTFVH